MKLGRYELQEVIGRGAMGIVYRAFDPETRAVVAVKIINGRATSSPRLMRRFEQECAAATRLTHPNIVRALDFGVFRGESYLVMEYIEGKSLGKHVLEKGVLTPAKGVALTARLADALGLAHSHGLVHRDVKPDNVLMTADGQPKLGDLGLVKDLQGGTDLTQSGTWLGTVDFMAPEQFGDAKHVDGRCDVYGLAATLYYILSGDVPFPAPGELGILRKKSKNNLTPLGKHVRGLPAGLEEAIAQAMDADPARRPPTCAAFAAQLEAAAANHVPPEGPEARQDRRYPTRLEVSCRRLLGHTRHWPSRVTDVSATGLCLEVDRRYEPGTVLTIELGEDGEYTYMVRAKWVREVGPGRWHVGCTFNQRLTEPELRLLLENKSPTVLVCPE